MKFISIEACKLSTPLELKPRPISINITNISAIEETNDGANIVMPGETYIVSKLTMLQTLGKIYEAAHEDENQTKTVEVVEQDSQEVSQDRQERKESPYKIKRK